MGFDRRLEAVDPGALLDPPYRGEERLSIGHRRHLFVSIEPTAQLAVQGAGRRLGDGGDPGADLLQGADELPLVGRKGGLDEDDVHGLGRA